MALRSDLTGRRDNEQFSVNFVIMSPLFIPAAAQAGFGLLQTVAGALIKPKRPRYNIPGAVSESVAMARQMANTTVRPGNDRALADIERGTTNSIQQAKAVSNSGSQLLDFASQAGTDRLRAISGNNAMNAQFSFNAKRNLQDQLGNLGRYQDRQWDYNSNQPYQQKAQLKSSLIGAGLQNMWGASESAQFANTYGRLLGDMSGAPTTRSAAMSMTTPDTSVLMPTLPKRPQFLNYIPGTRWVS